MKTATAVPDDSEINLPFFLLENITIITFAKCTTVRILTLKSRSNATLIRALIADLKAKKRSP